MAHLEFLGIPYSAWGSDAVKGEHQVFFYDPYGNVIEVHQIMNVDWAAYYLHAFKKSSGSPTINGQYKVINLV